MTEDVRRRTLWVMAFVILTLGGSAASGWFGYVRGLGDNPKFHENVEILQEKQKTFGDLEAQNQIRRNQIELMNQIQETMETRSHSWRRAVIASVSSHPKKFGVGVMTLKFSDGSIHDYEANVSDMEVWLKGAVRVKLGFEAELPDLMEDLADEANGSKVWVNERFIGNQAKLPETFICIDPSMRVVERIGSGE